MDDFALLWVVLQLVIWQIDKLWGHTYYTSQLSAWNKIFWKILQRKQPFYYKKDTIDFLALKEIVQII